MMRSCCRVAVIRPGLALHRFGIASIAKLVPQQELCPLAADLNEVIHSDLHCAYCTFL